LPSSAAEGAATELGPIDRLHQSEEPERAGHGEIGLRDV
jgi:hypothetical protein